MTSTIELNLNTNDELLDFEVLELDEFNKNL